MLQPIDFNRDSKQVADAQYDPDEQKLVISYRSGGTYTYHGVDESKANEFSQAKSAGGFLHNFVKGQHTFTKNG